MKRLYWALSALVTAALITAACSGGGGSSLISVGTHQFKTGFIRASLRMPPQAQMRHIDGLVEKALEKRGVKPHFLPGDTNEVDFVLETVNGIPNTDTSFNLSLFPQAGCVAPNPTPAPATPTPLPTGFQCSVTQSAPAAADQYFIVACYLPAKDGCLTDANAVRLSESNVTINVQPGKIATANFSLNPVVLDPAHAQGPSAPRPDASIGGSCNAYAYQYGGLSWCGGQMAGTWTNGGNAPSWNVNTMTYSCTQTIGGCYDPILNGYPPSSGLGAGGPATPVYDNLVLNVYDQEGDIIVPASAGGTVGSTAIYLKDTGAEDDITVTCTDTSFPLNVATPGPVDTHVLWLSSTASSIPQVSPIAASDRANGALGATYPNLNSPLGETYNGQNATDFLGNPTKVHSNNGGFINFDGGSNNYGVNSGVACKASDSYTSPGPNTTTYYVGLATGGIGWGTNVRHLANGRHNHR